MLGLAVLVTSVGTWLVLEFIVWNRVPAELVGRWEVVEGPPEYRDAVFEFYRSGKMVGHFNDNKMLRVIYAEVRIEGDKIYSTTWRERTGEEKVTVQTIRSLTNRALIVVDDRGKVIKMARAK